MRIILVVFTKATSAVSLVGVTTAPSDSASFLRSLSDMIEQGGSPVYAVWVGALALLFWAGFDVYKHLSRKRKPKEADPAQDSDDNEAEVDVIAERTGKASNVIDSMEAMYVIGQFLEPALRGNSRAIVIHRQFLDNFEKTTGAKVGEYEYNAELLREWLWSNAARFLVENQGDMR